MRNLILELESNSIEYFIIRSYLTCDFEVDDSRSEYHIYHKTHEEIGKWNNKCTMYPSLRFKTLSKKELNYFRENQDKFRVDHEDFNGKVWVSVSLGFKNPQKQ